MSQSAVREKNTVTEATSEMSMDEILASIRKIISNEDQQSPKQEDVSSRETPHSRNNDKEMEGSSHKTLSQKSEEIEEVLELTDMVDEEGEVISLNARGQNNESTLRMNNYQGENRVSGKKEAETSKETQKSAPTPKKEDKKSGSQASKGGAKKVENESEESLMSTHSLLKIKDTMTKLEKATSDGNTMGRLTLEDLVVLSLKPLLREWLDENLPTIVERMVAEQIARIIQK